MAQLHIDRRDIDLDNDGFLCRYEDWDEQVAEEIAHEEGIDHLTDEQREIIKLLRRHYATHESFPILASICKKAGSKTRDCVAREFHNPMAAWKIAGLPKPPNVFFTSFDGDKYIANPFY